MSGSTTEARDEFRALHGSGCFLIPNPWDIGTARYLHHVGYLALATTSAGFAFSRGRPDSVQALTKDEALTHFRELVAATPLPVNADFQHGYATQPEEILANVTECLGTGVAGLSIEDATGDPYEPLFELDLAIQRVQAACAARDAAAPNAVITARCEAFLVNSQDPERIVLDRLVAFADAGADCLFAPGMRDPTQIGNLVRAVAPKPVNVLMSSPHPNLDFDRLATLGVRRISVGSAFARLAWGAFMVAAKSLARTGNFDSLRGAASFDELDEIFG